MPAGELFTSMEVELNVPVVDLMGSPKMKAICSVCGEEILNGREVYSGEEAYCRACAGEAYYHKASGFSRAEKYATASLHGGINLPGV
jgi:formylmethanofuran dehydrogenase subunit E